MRDIINTLLVSCILAMITRVVKYLTASRNAKTQIASLQESNKHEIEKLMRQHEVDIEALKEKHNLEAEKNEQEHRNKVEIMEIEHRNALESKGKEQSYAAMFGVMADVIKDPGKLQGIFELANNPVLKKEVEVVVKWDGMKLLKMVLVLHKKRIICN